MREFSGPVRKRRPGAIVTITNPETGLKRSAKTGEGRDPDRIRSRKATVVWVARFSTRLAHEPQPTGSPRQGHPANPATRECDDHDEL